MGERRGNRGIANWGKFYSGFSQALADASKTFTKEGVKIFTGACKNWLSENNAQWPRGEGGGAYKSGYRGGDHYYPWFTGTLHDSMVAVVSDRNQIKSINYMQDVSRSTAWKDQTWKGQNINGRDCAEEVARRSQYVFLPGIQIRLLIGVPYARELDEKESHSGYIEEFERDFGSYMTSIAESKIKNISFTVK